MGGCVRDVLRNVSPNDYDVATSALPSQVISAFSDVPVNETGIKHGTVTVLWDGLSVEVTTYRVDGEYADGRHPRQVSFTRSITEDLARRDFTVNAMAWEPDGGLLDPFQGQQDLKAGILRCVGDPFKRFSEDGLRILRLLRFASVLGFSVEAETDRAARELKERLNMVSEERIREEFVKLLCGESVFPVLTAYPQIVGVFLPEIRPAVGFDQRNYHHVYDVYTHICHVVASVPAVPSLRLAAFFHDIAKPETFFADQAGVGHFYGHASRSADIADRVLGRLKVDNRTRSAVVSLVRHHDSPMEPNEKTVRRRLNKHGPGGFFDLVSLARGDNLAQAPEYRGRQAVFDQLEAIALRILKEKQCFSLKDLAVKGEDLLALGYEGRAVGNALRFLLAAVLDGECVNERDALLQYLSSMAEENESTPRRL